MAVRGAVACGHPATAAAATAVLKDGGNAFDAVLAAVCVATVAEPVLTSLGGGGFLIARPAAASRHGDRPLIYDFFAQTPLRRRADANVDFRPVHAEFGDARQEFHIGLGAVATPGVVRGLFAIHADLATMPMSDLVAPAVALARAGCAVEPVQAMMFRLVAAIFAGSADTLALYGSAARPGELPGEGEVLRQPALADLLETLATEGEDLFYRGEVAARVVADCTGRGGHLQAADFARYAVVRRPPLAVESFGCRLWLNPPPAIGGLLVAFVLEMLRSAGLEALPPGSVPAVTRLVRAMAATSAARVNEAVDDLDPAVLAETVLAPALLDRYRQALAQEPRSVRGTTHISVIDAAGNAAALSLSNGSGSGYVAAGTGIHFNNMLGEADLNPRGLQAWPADRRISSMMCPTLVVDRAGAATVLGSGGSNRIRSAILQVLVNLLALRLAVETAVAAPRLHLEDGTLSLEPGFSEAVLAAVALLADRVEPFSQPGPFFGGVHTVRRDPNGGFSGAGDPRRGGVFALA